MTVHKPTAPFYAVAAAALGYAALFPLYRPVHFALLAAISLAVFFGVTLLCRGAAPKAAPAEKKPAQPKEASTGNAELDKMLKDGALAIQEMKRLDVGIADPGISADIVRLEQVSQQIFDLVRNDPSKLPQIRKFMDYYLPTTLKMVKSYRKLDERSLPMAEAREAQHRIDDALGVVITGCQKMLKNLYKDDMLDIATDIDVLEQMLKRDGLTESELEKAAEQAKQAARLDAALAEQRRQQRAAQEAQTRQSAPTLHTDSGVQQAVSGAEEQARQHMPQAPMMSGGVYPVYDGQAAAQAKKDE